MNKELWNLYKDSERGKKAISTFNPNPSDYPEAIKGITNYFAKWLRCIKPEQMLGNYFLFDTNISEYNFPGDQIMTRGLYSQFIDVFELIDFSVNENGDIKWHHGENAVIIKRDKYRDKAAVTHILSLCLYYQHEFFIPVMLQSRFDVLQNYFNALGISIPKIPRTNNWREYCLYYYDLCEAVWGFKKEYELSDAETCAAIYDFASILIGHEKDNNDLPDPTNVWITGASGGDFKILDNLGKGDNSLNPDLLWACNEQTHKGDIIVIYCTSPRSYVHSIWRANSDGIFNPFDYYHCRTTVCDGVIIPKISFRDLTNDSYFSKAPIVRKRLQGCNGCELTAQDYSELLRLITEKGGKTMPLPKLFECSNIDFGEIAVEKDVEERVLIPMLERLGYVSKDWVRQLKLKKGRTETEIPDFVFFPHGDKHFENAPMVIEVKKDISSTRQRIETFNQARSYANALHSSVMGICDKERLIIYRVKDGFADRNNPVYENHWKVIYANEVEGAKLKKIIGKEVIKNIINQ